MWNLLQFLVGWDVVYGGQCKQFDIVSSVPRMPLQLIGCVRETTSMSMTYVYCAQNRASNRLFTTECPFEGYNEGSNLRNTLHIFIIKFLMH